MGKRFVSVQLLFTVIFVCLVLRVTHAGEPPPVAALPDAGAAIETATEENERYTIEEFEVMSITDQRNVYLHHSQRLPNNFSPLKYPLLMQAE